MNARKSRTSSVEPIRQANLATQGRERETERVRLASLLGVWLLIPLALGGVAFVLNVLAITVVSAVSGNGIPLEVPLTDLNVSWLVTTLVFQTAYWCLVARPWFWGFWAVIPIVALIPTFFIARRVLAEPAEAAEAAEPVESERVDPDTAQEHEAFWA